MKLSDKIRQVSIADAYATLPSEVPIVDYEDWADRVAVMEDVISSAKITEKDVLVAYAAAFSISGSPKHSRAMHVLIQEFPPLRWFGIVRSIHNSLNIGSYDNVTT